jgi:asparagine synthetase B (glutamine-hydrolysing)
MKMKPSVYPQASPYFVARLAAEQVKVVLTGEGSDELYIRLATDVIGFIVSIND